MIGQDADGRLYDDEIIPDIDEEEEEKAHQHILPVRSTVKSTTPDLCVKVKIYYNTLFKNYVAKNTNLGSSPKEVIQKIVIIRFLSNGQWVVTV